MKRNIVQMQAFAFDGDRAKVIALADDGTLWQGIEGFQGTMRWLEMPGLPQGDSEHAYPHQYTADDCPGRPCGAGCDHRGTAPRIS